MLTFTLAISCLTTSNLPWLRDLTFQVPMQYCSLQRWFYFHHQSHPHWVLFLLCFCLFIISGVSSPPISSSTLGTYWPGEFLFQCPIILPFHTIHGVLKARILKWCAIPFSSAPHFVRTLHLTHPSWVGLHGMAHSFIELDKAVVHVISLISFLWLWFSFCWPSDG